MKKSTLSGSNIAALVLVCGLGCTLTGCGGGSGGANSSGSQDSNTPPISTPTPTPVSTAACPTSPLPLSQGEMSDAMFMREEEKLARDVYTNLAAYWQARIGNAAVVNLMGNISQSEQQHMDSMKSVLACYGLPDPVDTKETPGIFIDNELAQLYATLIPKGQTSQLDALKIGALIEEVDIEDLGRAIGVSQQAYIDTVYANLACGSRNHLRSFAAQIASMEGRYSAQALSQSEVDAIVASPRETCAQP
ncbi:MAG: DUF2202 domain-containing protein [Pseudomonadota bacterium]